MDSPGRSSHGDTASGEASGLPSVAARAQPGPHILSQGTRLGWGWRPGYRWLRGGYGADQAGLAPWGASQNIKEAEGTFLGSTVAEWEETKTEQSQREERSRRAPERSEFRPEHLLGHTQ